MGECGIRRLAVRQSDRVAYVGLQCSAVVSSDHHHHCLEWGSTREGEKERREGYAISLLLMHTLHMQGYTMKDHTKSAPQYT